MTPFVHFIRLFPQTQIFNPILDKRPYEPLPDVLVRDQNRPLDPQAAVPAMPGDVLRFLVPRSFLGYDPRYVLPALSFYWTGPNVPPFKVGNFSHNYLPAPVGRLRSQDGSTYSEIRIRVSAAPDGKTFRQFAIVYDDPDTGQETPVLGTFRGQQTSLSEYVEAIRAFYASYPYTPVTVDVLGNELIIRAFHSDRFRLGHVPLRVGLGRVLTDNPNAPSFSLASAGGIDLPAQDQYSVTVLDDIEAGNVFRLNGRSYTADGTELPADVLTALGVPDGALYLPTGAATGARVSPGSVVLANNNLPRIELLFDTSDGNGDYYRVSVADNVTAGNSFQVTIDGQPTKTITAGPADTRATIEAYFATALGATRLLTPAGKTPVGQAVAGVVVTPNTNGCGLICQLSQVLPPRRVNRYVSAIGTGIRRGNRYYLGNVSFTAPSDQSTPADIAAGLGQTSYPFRIDLPAGTRPPQAYAEPGPAYQAPLNLAAVDVLAGSIWRPDGPLVAEVQVPAAAKPGRYQLQLARQPNNKTDINDFTADFGLLRPYALSTYIDVQSSAKDTLLLTYGPGDGPGLTMGYEYNEPGLMQQVRVFAGLSTGTLKQTESWGESLDGQQFRTAASAERSLRLTTGAQPETFHRAMYQALKHQQVWLTTPDFRRLSVRSMGDYKQTALGGVRKLQQGATDLIEENTRVEDAPRGMLGGIVRGASAQGLAMGAVLIDTLSIPGGMAIYLENTKTGAVRQIRPGSLLTPGSYRLRVRSNNESLLLTAYVSGLSALQTTLTPAKLNRTDQVLLLPAEATLSIITHAMPLLRQAPITVGFLKLPFVTAVKPNLRLRTSAFSTEFGPYFQP